MDGYEIYFELESARREKISQRQRLKHEIKELERKIEKIKSTNIQEQAAAPTPEPATEQNASEYNRQTAESIANVRKLATLYLLDWSRSHRDLSLINRVPSQQQIADTFGVQRTSLFCPDCQSGRDLIEFHRRLKDSYCRDYRVRGSSFQTAVDPDTS